MPRKRDVGMAGSSGYDTEFYTTDTVGNPVPNLRTMRLQGMNPNKRLADSRRQEERMEAMMDAGVQPSKRDRVRAYALRASMNERRGTYNENKFQDQVEREDTKRQFKAMDRGERQDEIIAQQARQAYVRSQVGKNDFNSPNARTTPTLSKMVKAGNKKK